MATVTDVSPARSTNLLSAAPTCAPRPSPADAGPVQVVPLAVFVVVAAVLLWFVGSAHGAQKATLLGLGLGLGLALFHSRFGFTSAGGQLIAVGNGAGLRAHALLLGTTATLAAILIGTSTGLFGSMPAPAGAPIGLGLILGSFIFGVGARLASGCNIGAYLGGISTGSLSGWIWGLTALAGTWVGLKLRPLFGLGNPKPNDSIC